MTNATRRPTMRAVVYDRYGSPEVLRLVEVDVPRPRDDEVLVRVRATTVNRTDCGFRDPSPVFVRCFSGLRRPRRPILGSEFAGEVEAVGAAVMRFAPGERVFGVNADRFGAHAEFVCVRERAPIAKLPSRNTFEEGAAVCDGAILALTCLRWARLRRGQRILVHGASGSIGTAAVQLARHMGAHVTAVCGTGGVETVGSLGAERVIDYTRSTGAIGWSRSWRQRATSRPSRRSATSSSGSASDRDRSSMTTRSRETPRRRHARPVLTLVPGGRPLAPTRRARARHPSAGHGRHRRDPRADPHHL